MERFEESGIPTQPIDAFVQPLKRFLHIEAASGVVLLLCTAFAIAIANSAYAADYLAFWKTEVGISFGSHDFRHSLKHWVNDGLMAIFFFVIGLEVKREIVAGGLKEFRKATLPVAAAIGGMVVPALIYLSIQWGQPTSRGWGIPMATDIAFVIGCMALIGSRVPHSLRILLLSLAIVDDIGAILVIAVVYTEDLSWNWLLLALLGVGVVHLLARLGVRRIPVYVLVGSSVWFAFHESGVHATLAGVVLGLMTPADTYLRAGIFRQVLDAMSKIFEGEGWETYKGRVAKVRHFQRLSRETVSPLEYMEMTLHPWTSFVIMPIFALANAGVPINLSDATGGVSLAIILGLVVGKPLGIVLGCWLAVKSRLAQLPNDLNWRMLLAAGALAGIGFTMSLFIAGLALGDEAIGGAKVGVIIGSAISATIGIVSLLIVLPFPATPSQSDAEHQSEPVP